MRPIVSRLLSAALLAIAGSALSPTAGLAGVERGQAAPYYAAIDSWSSGAALRRTVPGIERLGRAKATETAPTTEELLDLTFAPKASVNAAADAAIVAKLPRGYPTSGVAPELRKLRAAWAKQFAALPGDLDPDDLADVATVSAMVGLSTFTGDERMLTDPGALAVRVAFRQSLIGNAQFRSLSDARKQTAASMLAIRTLITLDTLRAERGQKDWAGVREVRAELRRWMRSGLGIDPARVALTATGLESRRK